MSAAWHERIVKALKANEVRLVTYSALVQPERDPAKIRSRFMAGIARN